MMAVDGVRQAQIHMVGAMDRSKSVPGFARPTLSKST
jgi:hypothetical protein